MLFGNVSAAIRILNNSVFVNDTIGGSGLNKSANITLYGLKTDIAIPSILKDGVACTQAMGCYNFTVLTAGTVSFNVTGWSNYSIADTPGTAGVSGCTNLTDNNTIYTQTANIVPVGTMASCINITASNVTFNGNGYWISNATYGKYGIYTSQVNSTIINTNITINSSQAGSGTGYAIYLWGANDSKVWNNNIGNALYGIYLQTASRNNVSANNINVSGTSSTGIYLDTRADNNSLTGNVISTGGPVGGNYGIY